MTRRRRKPLTPTERQARWRANVKRKAVAEGKASSQATRAALTARYEAIRANPDLPALPPARLPARHEAIRGNPHTER